MTTGRINQITSLAGRSPGPQAKPTRPGGPTPPKGQSLVKRKGRTGRPAAAMPPAYRGDTNGHLIAPTKLLGTGPHADIPTTARTGGDGLRHTALGRGARPPRDRRRTASGAGRLPPGYYLGRVMASGQQSTDFGIAGDPEIPGLQRPAAFARNATRREPTPGAEHEAQNPARFAAGYGRL